MASARPSGSFRKAAVRIDENSGCAFFLFCSAFFFFFGQRFGGMGPRPLQGDDGKLVHTIHPLYQMDSEPWEGCGEELT